MARERACALPARGYLSRDGDAGGGATPFMRSVVVSWQSEVVSEFGLQQETLFLGAALSDRFQALSPTVRHADTQVRQLRRPRRAGLRHCRPAPARVHGRPADAAGRRRTRARAAVPAHAFSPRPLALPPRSARARPIRASRATFCSCSRSQAY
jgi:hypothetical protein